MPQFTVPSDTHLVGDAGHTTDHNSIVDGLKSTSGYVYNVMNKAYSGGATGNGSTDDTTAIQAAVTAVINAGGGTLFFPPGTYVVSSTITASLAGTYVQFVGVPGATTISFTGTGDCIMMLDTSTPSGRVGHGWPGLTGITIDGTSAGNSSAGLHIGDIQGLFLDLVISNFSGTSSIGCHFDNANFWTEQCTARLWLTNCTTHVVFDVTGTGTNSYARGKFEFLIKQNNTNFAGVVIQAGSLLYDCYMRIGGNFASNASSSTGVVLKLTGTNSRIRFGELFILCEVAAGSFTPQTINFGAGSNTIIDVTGMIDFSSGGNFTASNNAGNMKRFWGSVDGDATLGDDRPHIGSNGNTTQAIATTATSGSPVNVTDLGVSVVATTAFRVRLFVPYSSAASAGVPTFIFTGPGQTRVVFNWAYQTNSSPFTTAPTLSDATSLPTMAGPTLSTASNLALIAEGVMVFSAGGTLQLQAYTDGTNAFTVGHGAYLEATPAYLGD